METQNPLTYFFGKGHAEGTKDMKELLGGKGANLAEMTNIGIPVPSGFTITTEVCRHVNEHNKYPEGIEELINQGIKRIEDSMKMEFGNIDNPLLVSVRSGAAQSMPGMMDTILNLGLNKDTVEGLAQKTNNPRFAWDSYRRFIQMYGEVVKKIDHENFEKIIETQKKGIAKERSLDIKEIKDTDLDIPHLRIIVSQYKDLYQNSLGESFPENPKDQLWGAIDAVFNSWNNPRAIKYRKIHKIEGLIGTAVNVQAMVFGNMGESSATGVAFSRNPSTGENKLYGEYLINAQGEDVVAGIRTPHEITIDNSKKWAERNNITEDERKEKYPSLEEYMPEIFHQLLEIKSKLENYYNDMQDMEFTIQEKQLYFLQTRTGKRTAAAALKIAVDMVNEKMISKETAIARIKPQQIDQLLHPVFKSKEKKDILTRGLNASPGAAVGKIVFTADDAENWNEQGESVILVRTETSPEDIGGMDAAKGILTSRGGATSHAAVVARQMGKPCIAGAADIIIDEKNKAMTIGSVSMSQGDYISIDGSTGEVIKGVLDTEQPSLSGDFATFMEWVENFNSMKVRANADTPQDAKRAKDYGALGIGLCRTEHMFFQEDRLVHMRKMILSESQEERIKALSHLKPMQQDDFEKLFCVMEGLPVIIRLLDPPLHEFLPNDENEQKKLTEKINYDLEKIKHQVDSLSEYNPMLGFRGCRLAIVYPEILTMQVEAIIDAAINVQRTGLKVQPEIMFPLVGNKTELDDLTKKVKKIISEKKDELSLDIKIMTGTMIEVPRAAITADELAESADFFSFGTNDLTQMTCGFSRDDSGSFLNHYIKKGLYQNDPFQVLDQKGVGRLINNSINLARDVKPDLEIGICGEHGGDPSTIDFCYQSGFDYVSCSPYRVPVARLASAQAEISHGKNRR